MSYKKKTIFRFINEIIMFLDNNNNIIVSEINKWDQKKIKY